MYQKNKHQSISSNILKISISSILLLVLTFLLLLGAEKTIEIQSFQTYKKAIGKERYIELKEHQVNAKTHVQSPPNITFPPFILDTKRSWLQTDSNGFIVTDKNHVNPDLKLFFLGGSTTECLYVPENKRYPERTTRFLEDTLGMKINSYNGGVGGIHSLHSLNILLNKVLPQAPDYIFFQHNMNDMVALNYLGSYWTEDNKRAVINGLDYRLSQGSLKKSRDSYFPHLSARWKKLFERLEVVDEFIGKRQKVLQAGIDSTERIMAFKRNIQTFINICKAHEVPPILLTQAHNFDVLDFEWFETYRSLQLGDIKGDKQNFMEEGRKVYESFNNAIIELGRKNQCLVIDLDGEINDTRFFYDEIHYNAAGSEKAAAVIFDSMVGFLGLDEGLRRTKIFSRRRENISQ